MAKIKNYQVNASCWNCGHIVKGMLVTVGKPVHSIPCPRCRVKDMHQLVTPTYRRIVDQLSGQ